MTAPIPPRASPVAAFFARRWQRQVPLGVLFWRDMIVVGTAINLMTAVASFLALAMKAELAVVLPLYAAAMPYNVFLVACVWRTADLAEQSRAASAKLGATLWLVIATII